LFISSARFSAPVGAYSIRVFRARQPVFRFPPTTIVTLSCPDVRFFFAALPPHSIARNPVVTRSRIFHGRVNEHTAEDYSTRFGSIHRLREYRRLVVALVPTERNNCIILIIIFSSVVSRRTNCNVLVRIGGFCFFQKYVERLRACSRRRAAYFSRLILLNCRTVRSSPPPPTHTHSTYSTNNVGYVFISNQTSRHFDAATYARPRVYRIIIPVSFDFISASYRPPAYFRSTYRRTCTTHAARVNNDVVTTSGDFFRRKFIGAKKKPLFPCTYNIGFFSNYRLGIYTADIYS